MSYRPISIALAMTFLVQAPVHAAMPSCPSQPATMPAGITQLHQRDVAATLSGDAKMLRTLWTHDALRMEPGSPAEVGLDTIYANDRKGQEALPPGAGTLTYEPRICALEILGNRASEWGYFSTSWRESASGPVRSVRAKFFRVLRRDARGEWRFSAVIWNVVS